MFEAATEGAQDFQQVVKEYEGEWKTSRAVLIANLRNRRRSPGQVWREWRRNRKAAGGNLRKILKVEKKKQRKRFEEYIGG